jgi:hypothetical protein
MLGYVKVLVNENNGLKASVELYKQQALSNAVVAEHNKSAYIELQSRINIQNQKLTTLYDEISKLKEVNHIKEREIIKYVESLPEGFEKSCLNMRVPNNIGGMSN